MVELLCSVYNTDVLNTGHGPVCFANYPLLRSFYPWLVGVSPTKKCQPSPSQINLPWTALPFFCHSKLFFHILHVFFQFDNGMGTCFLIKCKYMGFKITRAITDMTCRSSMALPDKRRNYTWISKNFHPRSLCAMCR